MSVLEILGSALLVLGSCFVLLTGVALLRLPDFFSRIHGAGIADTIGAGCLLIGFAFHTGFSLTTVKLMMIMVFLVLTAPVAAHVLARAAFLQGVVPILGIQASGGDESEELETQDGSRNGIDGDLSDGAKNG